MFSTAVYADSQIHTYKIESDVFELKYELQPNSCYLKDKDLLIATGSLTTELALYSIYKNGKLINSSKDGGGIFSSCRYKPPSVFPIKSTKSQIGWMLIGGGICGNTSSYNIELIVPKGKQYYSETFISKFIPTIQPLSNGASVWYYQQNWGHGGTASSFLEPKKLTIDLTGDFSLLRKGNLLKDIKQLEKASKQPPSFLGLFVAGIRDVNPDLMQYALDNLYSLEEKEQISVHLKKADKDYLQSLINKIKTTEELLVDTEDVVTVLERSI